MDHGAGDLGAPAALDDHRHDLVFPAQPGDSITTHRQAVGQGQLVVDEPVSERRVIGMHVDGGVGQVSVIPVPLADRVRLPGIERLLGEPQHAASRGHRDPLSGQVDHQGIHHFGFTPRPR